MKPLQVLHKLGIALHSCVRQYSYRNSDLLQEIEGIGLQFPQIDIDQQLAAVQERCLL